MCFKLLKLKIRYFLFLLITRRTTLTLLVFLKIRYAPTMDEAFYHSRCMAHIINLAVQDVTPIVFKCEYMDFRYKFFFFFLKNSVSNSESKRQTLTVFSKWLSDNPGVTICTITTV